MCGIFGYIGKRRNAAKLVFSRLKDLEYRGYDSWGVAVVKRENIEKKADDKNREIIIKKKAGKIGSSKIDDLPKSSFVLGHTRWATHGGVTDKNAHPHTDCTGSLAIVHNGIIENYSQIKKELKEKGHNFVSDTDTEVAVHAIEQQYQEKLKGENQMRRCEKKDILLQAVRKSFNRFEGLNAIIVMNADLSCFIAAKNGSPLVLGKGKEETFLSSDAHALISYTRKVYFFKDGQIAQIDPDKISVYQVKSGKRVKIAFQKLDWKKTTARKGKFSHFMLKEIYDQPRVIERLLLRTDKQLDKFARNISRSYGTYFVGCGTAAYACLSGTYIFSKVAKRHVNFSVGSEFSYLADFLTEKSFVVALSQSGETIDVIEAVKSAKEKKAKIGALVNVLGSTLYRISDVKLLLEAGVEKAVVSTKAFCAKLSYLILLAYILDNRKKEGEKVLRRSIASVKNVLEKRSTDKIRQLADVICKEDHIYVIGRGKSYPIALETSLKIKESSYIHAEGFAAGELKHGVIALVEKGTPCIAYLPNDETYGANLSGAMEMKARGGYIIGISYKPHEIFDYFIPFDDCGIASMIPQAVIGQLLGYYLAIKRGLDPDKPRNLAKSVTVK